MLCCPGILFSQKDSIPLSIRQDRHVRQIGFFDLNIGPDIRHAQGTYDYPHGILGKPVSQKKYASDAMGITGRMQSSFLGNHLLKQENKRFRAGDVLAAEASLGFLSTNNPSEKPGLWIAYRFEFGATAMYRINDKNELGITFTLLRFSRDRVSPNISGSAVLLKYRHNNWIVEGGLEVRRDRIVSWIFPLTGNSDIPLQYAFGTRHLFGSTKNAGLRFELLTGKSNLLIADNGSLRVDKIWSLRFFYGIYF